MKRLNNILLLVFILLSINTISSQEADPIPEHETFTIASSQVGETRVINVWTPPAYKNSSESLPVLYMPDGGIKEDFPHIANTLAELIEKKKIKPMILVGIENTVRKRDLTGFTENENDKKMVSIFGGSDKFRAFIKEELFPEINKRYRTTDEKSIIGESAAGLFIMETFFLTPEMFNNYIAIDPSIWWNNLYLLKHAKEYLTKFPDSFQYRKLWFAGSNAPEMSKSIKKLAKIFSKNNLQNFKWTYSDEPKESHSTIFRATKVKALIWTFGQF